jgi:dTDP-4-amino-4,6-dideoxygalactose transaminase
MKNFFALNKIYENNEEKILEKFKQICKKGDFILGEEIENLEIQLEKFLNVKKFIGVGNGTDALFLALKTLGIGTGDKVITTPMSYLASTSSIYLTGAEPIFVDVDDSFNINPECIDAVDDSRVKAILPVHLAGNPANMERIMEIANKKSLYVVEDCAQAFGSSIFGKRVGTFGHLNAFSFHPLKILGAFGDAGGLSTNNINLSETVKRLRNHGHTTRDDVSDFSHNMRLDTIQAGILEVLLSGIDDEIKFRQQQVRDYQEALSKLMKHETIKFQYFNTPIEEIGFNFLMIRVDDRTNLMDFLKENGYETKIHYPRLLCDLGPNIRNFKGISIPNARRFSDQIMSLPLGRNFNKSDINSISKLICKFYGI